MNQANLDSWDLINAECPECHQLVIATVLLPKTPAELITFECDCGYIEPDLYVGSEPKEGGEAYA